MKYKYRNQNNFGCGQFGHSGYDTPLYFRQCTPENFQATLKRD